MDLSLEPGIRFDKSNRPVRSPIVIACTNKAMRWLLLSALATPSLTAAKLVIEALRIQEEAVVLCCVAIKRPWSTTLCRSRCQPNQKRSHNSQHLDCYLCCHLLLEASTFDGIISKFRDSSVASAWPWMCNAYMLAGCCSGRDTPTHTLGIKYIWSECRLP